MVGETGLSDPGHAGDLPPVARRLHPRQQASAEDPDTLVGACCNPHWWWGSAMVRRSWHRICHVHRPHPAGHGTRAGPGHHDHAGGVEVTGFPTACPPTVWEYEVTWDANAAEKAATTCSCSQGDRRATEGRWPTPCSAGITDDNRLVLDGLTISDTELREIDKIVVAACGYRLPRRTRGRVRHRALDADPGRGGTGQRVPLPGPDPGPPDAGGGDFAVRRDHGHPDGGAARP